MSIDTSSLTTEEKRQLYDDLAFELRSKHALPASAASLWQEINDCLRTKQPLQPYLDKAGHRKLITAAEAVDLLTLQALPGRPTRIVRLAMRQLLLRCLRDHLEDRNIPQTASTMVQNCPSLAHAVDNAFPGYLQAGLLHKLVQTTPRLQVAV
jgi:hypothetical protein